MVIRRITAYLIVFILGVILALEVFAQGVGVDVRVLRTRIRSDEKVQLNITYTGMGDVPAPALPEMEGFESIYLGTPTMDAALTGAPVIHAYGLIPKKAGRFEVGPWVMSHGGREYPTNSVIIEVGQASSRAYSDFDPYFVKGKASFTIEPAKTTAYINERIPIVVSLNTGGLVLRVADVPTLRAEGFSVGEFSDPRNEIKYDGDTPYAVVEFDNIIFATQGGNLTLGPAEVVCNAMTDKNGKMLSTYDIPSDFLDGTYLDDYFAYYDIHTFTMEARPVMISVGGLPYEGRPEHFKGAVGDFSFLMKVSPQTVQVGDPITLKMKIFGRKNLDTVTAPVLSSGYGFEVYEARERLEPDGKIFEQVLIPQSESVQEIPKVYFSYYNPDQRQYYTEVAGPVEIEVKKIERAEPDYVSFTEMAPIEEEVEGVSDIVYIKTQPGKFIAKGSAMRLSPIFLVINILAIGGFVYGWRQIAEYERKQDPSYVRAIEAYPKAKKGLSDATRLMKKGNILAFYDTVFDLMKGYISDKFDIPQGDVDNDMVQDLLYDKSAEEKLKSQVETIFDECVRARYGQYDFSKNQMQITLRSLKDLIEFLNKQKTV